MKATLSRDIILHLTSKGDTEIGRIPAGVGLERLRYDGVKVVDLAGFDEIWVEPISAGGFILHAIEVPRSHRVAMRYTDRKRLVMGSDGIPRLQTPQELAEEVQAGQREQQHALLSDQMRRAAGPLDRQVHQLRKTVYLLIEHIVAPTAATAAALVDILGEISGVYPLAEIRAETRAAAAAVRQAETTAQTFAVPPPAKEP